MKNTTRLVAWFLGCILLGAGIATSIEAGPRQAVPHHGGASPRATAPRHQGGASHRATAPPHHGVPALRTAAPRGHPAARGTANGVARYGYGYGYGYGYSGPWWSAGWYGSHWGADWYGGYWGWPGYRYAAFGPWYGPDDEGYVVSVDATQPRGPAVIETGVSPSNAEVVLDGDMVGFARDYSGRWDKLSVLPGPHTISFQMKEYRTLEIAFEARPGATYAFNDVLVRGEGEDRRTLPAVVTSPPPEIREPTPATTGIGRLRVKVDPPDTAVYLDGEYLGLATELARIHGALAVATGSHRLEAVRPGHVSAVRVIDVGDTKLTSVEVTLEPER